MVTETEIDAWTFVAAAQAGDRAAFGELYSRYVDIVMRFVLSRVGDYPLAEDLTGETFLRALRRLDSVSYQGRDVGAWFITIARNLVLDHVKSSRYKPDATTAEILDADTADGPEQSVIDADTARVLWSCVEQLTDEQREVIVLRYAHGLSVAETAAMVGRRDAAVKALAHRGIHKLAELLPDVR
jgi:RNA polymerase sigma-70 factor (ECF subfamily)